MIAHLITNRLPSTRLFIFAVLFVLATARPMPAGAQITTIDTDGPMMLSAVAIDAGTVQISFDEPLAIAPGMDTNNLRVIRSGTAGASATVATINSIAVSARIMRLRMGSDYDPDECYYVLTTNLTDVKGNLMAPNSVIGIAPLGSSLPCPIPSDPPLELLRLSIQKQTNGVQVSWPPGYHNFAIERSGEIGPEGLSVWAKSSIQGNGAVLPLTTNSLFRLKKVP